MDKTQDPIWKNSMNYGAIVGLALVVYNVVLYLFEFYFKLPFELVNYIIIIGGIVMGTSTLRENEFEGTLTYGKAVASGTLICLFSGILYAFYNYVLYAFIAPEMIEVSFYHRSSILQILSPTAQTNAAATAELKTELWTPFNISILSIPVFTFFGFIVSLLLSTFLKREKSPYDINE